MSKTNSCLSEEALDRPEDVNVEEDVIGGDQHKLCTSSRRG
jgi:hypothetical protein